jgi:hypothetical protein
VLFPEAAGPSMAIDIRFKVAQFWILNIVINVLTSNFSLLAESICNSFDILGICDIFSHEKAYSP